VDQWLSTGLKMLVTNIGYGFKAKKKKKTDFPGRRFPIAIQTHVKHLLL
jgi:hypothetical protein